jgi:hypothetical protein
MRTGEAPRSVNFLQEGTLPRKARITLLNCSGLCSGARWLTPGRRINSAPGILRATIFGMFGLDKLIMLALYNRDGYINISHIARRKIEVRLHHLAKEKYTCNKRAGAFMARIKGMHAPSLHSDRIH